MQRVLLQLNVIFAAWLFNSDAYILTHNYFLQAQKHYQKWELSVFSKENVKEEQ